MSKKYVLILSMILFFLSSFVMAFSKKPAETLIKEIIDPTCFKNGEEFKQNNSKIPEMFRKEPVLLGESLDIPFVDNVDVFVIVKISVRDQGVLHYSLNSWQATDKLVEDESEIENICFGSINGKKEKRMVVKLQNGKVIVGNVNESEKTLSLWTQESFPLKIMTEEKANKFAKAIAKRSGVEYKNAEDGKPKESAEVQK